MKLPGIRGNAKGVRTQRAKRYGATTLTDVKIAIQLLTDAFEDVFDVAQ